MGWIGVEEEEFNFEDCDREEHAMGVDARIAAVESKRGELARADHCKSSNLSRQGVHSRYKGDGFRLFSTTLQREYPAMKFLAAILQFEHSISTLPWRMLLNSRVKARSICRLSRVREVQN
jgi:hypothetical protein